MKELINLRKQREKHFLNKDGTITACMYDHDIHYLENGEYKEIDNTLVEENDYITNKSNDFKVEFSSKNLYKIVSENYFFECCILNISDYKTNKQDNIINYKNILKNIDIFYELIGKEIKENIIINNVDNELEKLVFKITTDSNLKIENNRIIGLKDDKEIFKITSPFLIFASNQTNNKIGYELSECDGGYLLSFKIDNEIISNSNNYPIIIDPTIMDTENLNVYDTFIHPNDENIERNNLDYLKIGVDSDGIPYRSLIKFDLPKMETGNDIISANIVLTSHASYNVPNEFIYEQVGVHQITESWTEETASWNNLANKYNQKLESSTILNRTHHTYEDGELALVLSYNQIDVTSLVKKWYSGTPNYGIMVKFIDEQYNPDCKEYYMYSKNNTETPNPKPILFITYRNHNGIVDYMSYNELNGSGFKTYINNYTGNITNIFDIAKLITNNDVFYAKLIFNTNNINNYSGSDLGHGWKFNFEQRFVFETIDGVEYAKYINDTGRIIYLKHNELNNLYEDEEGLGYTLGCEHEEFLITDRNNTRYYFVFKYNTYYLDRIVDCTGNTTSLTNYGGSIYEIKNGDKQIDITYYNDYISIMSDIGETIIRRANDIIYSIEYENTSISITYNEQNCIKEIRGYDGIGYNFEYYGIPYRVKKITELALNNKKGFSTNIEYGFNTTSFIDSDNKKITYIFDNIGRTIGTVGYSKNKDFLSEAYGYSASFASSIQANAKRNQLSSVTSSLKYINNLVNDSSFEGNNSNLELTNSSIVSNNSRSGKKALKLNSGVKSTISYDIMSSDDYTVSFYLKSNTTGSIHVSLYSKYNNEQVLLDSFAIDNNNEYDRYSLSGGFLVGSKLVLELDNPLNANTFIDDIQLETGLIANLYNMVLNSDFSQGLLSWDVSGVDMTTGEDITNYYDIVDINAKEHAFRFNSHPDYSMSLSKLFNVSGKAGDVYYLSFWYKNEGNEIGGLEQGNTVNIAFFSTDEEMGMEPDIYALEKNDTEWQFFSKVFIAETDYDDFSLSFVSQGEINNLYITNINLTKDYEDFLPEYDEIGNLISTKKTGDHSKNINRDKIKYNNNDYVKTDLANGQVSFCEYDENGNIISETHSSGITKRYYYDEFGNEYMTRILNIYENNNPISNGNFYIRQKNTMKYLNLNYQNKMCIFKEEECNKVVFNVVLNNENVVISLAVNPNLKLTTINNNIFLVDNSEYSYTLEKSDEEGYYIKEGNKYFYVDNNELVLSEEDKSIFIFETTSNKLYLEEKVIYDSNGKYIAEDIDFLGNKTILKFNSSTGLKESITTPNGKSTIYNYDSKRRVTSLICDTKDILYEYDEKDMLSKIKSGNKYYSFCYDDYSNYKSFKLNNNEIVNNEYEDGAITKNIYANGSIIKHFYDEHNRLKRIEKDNRSENYYYNNQGLLAKIIYDDNVYTNVYDYDSNISKKIVKHGNDIFKLNYKRDNNSNIEKKTFILNNIKKEVIFNRDSNSTLSSISYPELNTTILYNYDYLGRLINKSINDIVSIDYDFYRNGNKTSYVVSKYRFNDKEYEYFYDKNYNVLMIKCNGDILYSYSYNNYDELIEEIDYAEGTKGVYEYDLAGNMQNKKVYSLDSDDILSESNFEYNGAWEDQLTKYDENIITYDNIGNLVSIGNNILEWQNGRELKKFTNPLENLSIEYEYNQFGTRTKKIINNIETKYFIEGNRVVFEKRGNVVIYYIYDEKNNVVGLEFGQDRYYFEKNLYNDITGIIDANGTLVARYSYDAWGNLLSIRDVNNNIITDENSIAIINPFRYKSYYYDNETDLYYLNKRYYSSKLHRFINIDGTIGINQDIKSCNIYLYSSNNPIKNKDIDGDFAFLALGACMLVGAAANVAPTFVGDVVTSIKKKKPSFSNKKDYISKAVGGAAGGAMSFALPGSFVLPLLTTSITTSVTNSILNKKSGEETLTTMVEDLSVDMTVGLLTKNIPIPKITSGRNSYTAVFSSGITKLKNETAKKMSLKVLNKGIVSESTKSIIESAFSYLPQEMVEDQKKNPAHSVINRREIYNIPNCNASQPSNYPSLIQDDRSNDYYCICVDWD